MNSKKVNDIVLICFRFPAGEMNHRDLYEQNSRVVIDGKTYKYDARMELQGVVIDEIIEDDLYDQGIRFVNGGAKC